MLRCSRVPGPQPTPKHCSGYDRRACRSSSCRSRRARRHRFLAHSRTSHASRGRDLRKDLAGHDQLGDEELTLLELPTDDIHRLSAQVQDLASILTQGHRIVCRTYAGGENAFSQTSLEEGRANESTESSHTTEPCVRVLPAASRASSVSGPGWQTSTSSNASPLRWVLLRITTFGSRSKRPGVFR